MALRTTDLVNLDGHHETHEIKVNSSGLQVFLWIHENDPTLKRYKNQDPKDSSSNIVKAIRFLRIFNCHYRSTKILQRSDRQALNGEILGLMVSLLLTIFSVKPTLPPTKLSILLEIFLGYDATPYIAKKRSVMNEYAFPSLFFEQINFQKNDWYTAAQAINTVQFQASSVDHELLDHLCKELVDIFDTRLYVGLGAHHGEAVDLLR